MASQDPTAAVLREHAELFASEAADTLRHAERAVAEAARWRKDGRGDPDRIDRDLELLHAAGQLVDAIDAGRREFPVDRAVVETINGVLLTAVEQLGEAVERRPLKYWRVRELLETIEWFVEVLEHAESGNPVGARKGIDG